jgi:hypothetical protein
MSGVLDLPPVEDLPAPSLRDRRDAEEVHELITADVDLGQAVLDIVGKKKLDFNAVNSVLDARILETMTGSPTFTLRIHDPDLALLNSDVLMYEDRDGDFQLRAIDIDIDEHPFRLVGITWDDAEVGSGIDLTLTFEHRLVAFLREHDKPLKISRKRLSLSQFIQRMAREVKAMRIRFVTPDVGARNPIEKLTDTTKDANREPGLGKDDHVEVKGAKATSKQRRVIEQVLGVGERKGAKKKLLIVAIMVITQESRAGVENSNKSNPNVKGPFHQDGSYGTEAQRMDPTHAANEFFKRAIAADKQNPHSSYAALAESVQRSGDAAPYEQWHDEAARTVKAFGGTGSESRTYYKRFNYTRGVDGKKENSWDCSQRYAQLINWRSFVVGKATWYWISEPDLFKSRSRMTIDRKHPAVVGIGGNIDKGKKAGTLRVRARVKRWAAPPGSVVTIRGEGPADGRWLVEDIERSVFSPEANITLKKPTKPKPEPRSEQAAIHKDANNDGIPDDITLTGVGAARLYRECKRISDTGCEYTWGGGHGPNLENVRPRPGPGNGLDCSSSVSLALFRAGLFGERTTALVSGAFMGWGKAGQGKNFTVWWNAEHVWIEFHGLGNADRFDTSPHGSGGRGPRMRYVKRSTAGFAARHWPATEPQGKTHRAGKG